MKTLFYSLLLIFVLLSPSFGAQVDNWDIYIEADEKGYHHLIIFSRVDHFEGYLPLITIGHIGDNGKKIERLPREHGPKHKVTKKRFWRIQIHDLDFARQHITVCKRKFTLNTFEKNIELMIITDMSAELMIYKNN